MDSTIVVPSHCTDFFFSGLQGFIPWDDTNDIDIGVMSSDAGACHLPPAMFVWRKHLPRCHSNANSDKIYALAPLLSHLCGHHMIHRSDVAYLPDLTAFVIKVMLLLLI